jgi:hypothetical protein
MMSGTAVRTLKEASITESGLNPECLIETRWKVPAGSEHVVSAHQPKQTAMKLVSAAFIMTVHKNDLGPDLVLFPGLEMFSTSKPDNVFLEAAPCFCANALLLCAYGNPTIFAHPIENAGCRKKTVPFRNAFDWLGSENTRSKTAHFIIRNCNRPRDS